MTDPGPSRAFTLIELLVSVSIVALLTGLLLPALSGARDAGRLAACLSNQRQLVLGWSLYAQAHADLAMPLGDENTSGGPTYWWGQIVSAPGGLWVDHSRGYLSPYLDAALSERSAYECPSQPWGTYRAQPIGLSPAQPTSTYGYNGYYLTPARAPGWSLQIGSQRWKRTGDVERTSELFVFADTLLDGSHGGATRNCALLDPPRLFAGGLWSDNPFPTTSFRHAAGKHGATNTARADGSARATAARPEWLVSAPARIGSVGMRNDPHYVPDWRRWR